MAEDGRTNRNGYWFFARASQLSGPTAVSAAVGPLLLQIRKLLFDLKFHDT